MRWLNQGGSALERGVELREKCYPLILRRLASFPVARFFGKQAEYFCHDGLPNIGGL